ncbi:trypco2 family protein [Aeromonas media]|uniref:trypco2 family protein n=1 Tax=Aeromonas media TaxID=651 RepID=UPI0029D6F7A0|nr:trypco2 family protein [Aeromonas media]MDX7900058.1 trypco2 family protein [Aeromonas media]
MKGNISLKDFIDDVKKELIEASKTKSPFFLMDEVELEVSFGLSAHGKAGGRFVVFELGAEIDSSQVHRVKLKLIPYKEQEENELDEKTTYKFTDPRKLTPFLQARVTNSDKVNDKSRPGVRFCRTKPDTKSHKKSIRQK